MLRVAEEEVPAFEHTGSRKEVCRVVSDQTSGDGFDGLTNELQRRVQRLSISVCVVIDRTSPAAEGQ